MLHKEPQLPVSRPERKPARRRPKVAAEDTEKFLEVEAELFVSVLELVWTSSPPTKMTVFSRLVPLGKVRV
jgi:hypothetical protein